MASFLRLAARQGCRVLSSNIIRQQRNLQPACLISTSKKNKDAATIEEKLQTPASTEESLLDKDENWISYGYDIVDRDADEWSNHLMFFVGVTLCCIGGSFLLMYYPDFKMRDWIQREAYLELARREREGLPLVDKNVIPEEKVELPSEEELGSTDIII